LDDACLDRGFRGYCFPAAAVFGSFLLPAFASLPTPRPSAGNGTRNSSSCGPFKVQVGEYANQELAMFAEAVSAGTMIEKDATGTIRNSS
jgi:hypothetical protein